MTFFPLIFLTRNFWYINYYLCYRIKTTINNLTKQLLEIAETYYQSGFEGIYYIPRIIKASKLGDAAILKELIYILSENKIRVIKLNTYNPELTLSKGCYTKLKPNMIDKITIKKGIQILKKSNSFNHVQALVINNNKIVSFEKKKGTKDMLKSIRNNNLQNKLLLKMPKIKQDLRVDLPTIGLDTLKDCKKANIKGIIVKAGQNIFLDKQEAIKFANKNNIFVLAK